MLRPVAPATPMAPQTLAVKGESISPNSVRLREAGQQEECDEPCSQGKAYTCSVRVASCVHRSGTGDNMSLTNFPGSANSSPLDPSITKVTIPALAEMKRQGKPISALPAYDYATSRLVDEAGIDLILVGDSLAMVVLGHDNTLGVTVA